MLSITETVIPAVRQTVDADTPLPALVDSLADVQTAIATLEALEKNLKAQLIASGLDEICGSNVRARIVQVADSVSFDFKGFVEGENILIDKATFDRYMKVRKGTTSVRLFGYN